MRDEQVALGEMVPSHRYGANSDSYIGGSAGVMIGLGWGAETLRKSRGAGSREQEDPLRAEPGGVCVDTQDPSHGRPFGDSYTTLATAIPLAECELFRRKTRLAY